MSLGPLIAQVRASADEWSADLKKIQRDAKALQDGLKPLADPLAEMGKAGKEAGEKLEHSLGDAHGAALGLEQMFGVHLPRSVTRFLAESSSVGPVLAGAFSTVAVLGMIQALEQLPALFTKLEGAITSWDETAKKAYDHFLDENQKAVKAALDLLKAQNDLANRDNPVKALAGDYRLVSAALNDAQKESVQLEKDIARLRAAQGQVGHTGIPGLNELITAGVRAFGNNDELDKLNSRFTKLQATIAELTAESNRLRLIDMPKALAESADKAAVSFGKLADEQKKSLQQGLFKTMESDYAMLIGLEKGRVTLAAETAKILLDNANERSAIEKELGDMMQRNIEFWDKELQDIRTGGMVSGGADIKAGLDASARKAAEIIKASKDAAAALAKLGQDAINTFANDISRSFSHALANGTSFWTAFKDLGRSAIAGIADVFLKGMIHGFLDPFASQLGKAMNKVVNSAAGGATASAGGTGGDQKFSLSALVKGGAIAAATTLAVVGIEKVGSALVGMFGKMRKLANEFVQGTQNTLTASVTDLFANLTDAKAMGTLTVREVDQAKMSFEKMWASFQASAAAAGLVGQQGLATMTPFIASWREWLSGLDEAAAQLEHLAAIADIRSKVLGAAKGWENMEAAILSLEQQGVSTTQIIAFLGNDITSLASNLATLGYAVPPAMQGIVDLINAMTGDHLTKLRRSAAVWELPETGLVQDAYRRAHLTGPDMTMPALAAMAVPAVRAASAQASVVQNISLAPTFNVDGKALTPAYFRDVLMPEFNNVMETGVRGYREKLAQMMRDSLDGLTSTAIVPAH